VGFTLDNDVMIVDTAAGGPPELVTSLPGTGRGSGTWNRNGDIVLGSWGGGSGGPLWSVSRAGGAATAVTQVDVSRGELFHTRPTFLPDGRRFLYFRSGPPDVEGTYVGSLDVEAGNQSRERILPGSVPAGYANGHVFFLRDGTLMAQAFDADQGTLAGVAVPVAQDVKIFWDSHGVFAVSGNGTLAYQKAPRTGDVQIAWLDPQGRTLTTVGPPAAVTGSVRLSPQGDRAVVKDAPYGVPGDLWMLDLASGRRTALTFDRRAYSPGVWAPDGTRVAYAAGVLGDTIYVKAASGLGDAQALLTEPGIRHFPTSWSRDGRFLLYHTENTPSTGYDLWVLSVDDRRQHLLLGEAFNEWAGVFSPDMRYVAYVSLENTGGAQIYVRPFDASGQTDLPSLGVSQWRVAYGNWPQWRAREIVFNTAPGGTAVFAAAVTTEGAAFVYDEPQRMAFPPNVGIESTPQSDVDGLRFLMQLSEAPSRPSVSVVLNWPALLRP
jgi:serine/threonine-protein kinase